MGASMGVENPYTHKNDADAGLTLLSFPAPTNSTPFVQMLWETGQLDEPLFGLGLASMGELGDSDARYVVSGGYYVHFFFLEMVG